MGVARQRAHVQDLHADFDVRVSRMHRFGDLAVRRHLCGAAELGAVTGFNVRRDATGDDHAHAAPCALCVVSSQSGKAIFGFLQAGVHRAHDRSVFDLGKTQIQRRKQQGVARVNCHQVAWLGFS